MLMHLIFGPTCCGKTDFSIKLAQRLGWPVISLDRVQCCTQIATGSGRPSPAEIGCTERIYLADRPLVEGIIEADAAHAALKCVLESSESKLGMILEGGSISLLNAIMRDSYWSEKFTWCIHRLPLCDSATFLHRAKRRIRQMLSPEEGVPFLQELAMYVGHSAELGVLEGVDAYRFAITFARERHLSLVDLKKIEPELKEALIDGIAQEYLDHAKWQERDFPNIPATWKVQELDPDIVIKMDITNLYSDQNHS